MYLTHACIWRARTRVYLCVAVCVSLSACECVYQYLRVPICVCLSVPDAKIKREETNVGPDCEQRHAPVLHHT
jgi:hypothetical protein